tara:strand:- start:143 stop:685 length:543 start_codon:yes stop_codon:yes gene_type:complete
MSKWKNVRTYMEVNPYTGQPKSEDAPANATGVNVAGTGDDSSVVVVRKKKKTLIDARSKTYREHRKKLEQARQRREERKSRLAQKVEQNTGMFTREGYLEEEKPSSYILSTLRDIVKNKSAKSMKFKDGSMKVDMTTANMMLQVLDKINPMNKKKVMGILDKGGKGDFMKVHNVVMKALG